MTRELTITVARSDRPVDHWRAMTEHERQAMLDWLHLHQVDPKRVPVDTTIDLDRTTNEWRIEVYCQRNGRPYVDHATDTIPRAVIRRRWRAWCPMPGAPRP